MKPVFLIVALTFFTFSSFARITPVNNNSKLVFIENKGQIKDQNGKEREDIQFVLPAPGINIFIGNGQLHYQFSKTVAKNMNVPGTYIKPHLRQNPDVDRYEDPLEATITTYRLDVELIGANKNAKSVTGDKQIYYENFYLPNCPASGIRASSFKKITYKDIYPDIDWVIYLNGAKLEHEFIVGKKGDASQIKLRYNGHSTLNVDAEGNIVATTPMGKIVEKAPVCYTASGAIQESAYKLEGNILTYDLHGINEGILIDPELAWGTYYGPDSSASPIYSVKAFDSASIYACGLTWAGTLGTIATVGSYQYIFAGGGTDAFLIRFDSAGNRIWATYYGGSDGDWATGVDCDLNGMVYMCGVTGSAAGISTPGAQQEAYGGTPWDGFLVKFLPDGSRVWGTYIGGPGANYANAVACDAFGKVYLAGDTNEGINISTPSAARPVKAGGYDWYLVQYDTMGVRMWGSYYGGPGSEFAGVVCTDRYVPYMTGCTPSASGITTTFAYQPAIGGGNDAVVVKFFNSGILSWATYYGGANTEFVGGITCDIFRNIYIFGSTESDNNISTTGSYQPARSGQDDAFLVKFDPEMGMRVWGTYMGGTGKERADYSRITTDDSANIYVIGTTESTADIATDTAWQTTHGGGVTDAFLAKFNTAGAMKWCTYYGGDGKDDGRACSFFGEAVYICGQTNSTNNIATPDGVQPVGGGSTYDWGYVAKFADPDTTSIPVDTTSPPVLVEAPVQDDVHIDIYPNPNDGTFSISGKFGDRTGIAELTVMGISGRIILSDKTALHNGYMKEQVALGSGIPAGIYFLKVESPGIERVITFRKE